MNTSRLYLHSSRQKYVIVILWVVFFGHISFVFILLSHLYICTLELTIVSRFTTVLVAEGVVLNAGQMNLRVFAAVNFHGVPNPRS